MDLQIIEQSAFDLTEYGRLPISFTVDRVLEVTPIDNGLGGLIFTEARVEAPYVKDYDALEGNAPCFWRQRFDVSRWGVITALVRGELVGGAVLAFATDGLDMLEQRTDLAVLWDLRVHPDFRRRGVGQSLFHAALAWAHVRGCRQIKIETQNINVAACRFYAKQGCILGGIRRQAYVSFPTEVQLFWFKDL
jgi:GNAT superfamily N-acetyltransferase